MDFGKTRATSTQIKNSSRRLLGTELMYPNSLTEIPYASYFKITRWEYKKGLEEAAKNNSQRDVLASLGKNQGKMLNSAVNSVTQGTFNGVDKRMEQRNKQINNAIENEVSKIFQKEHGSAGLLKSRRKKNVKKYANNLNQTQDYSAFDYPIKLTDGTEIANEADLKEIRNSSKQHENSLQSIYYLPMPNEFQYSYDASWDNQMKLGTMARALDNLMAYGKSTAITTGAALGKETVKSMAGTVSETVDKELPGSTAFVKNVAKGGFDPFGNQDTLNNTNLVGLAGLAPNDNAIQMFQRMGMRSFDMTFELFARSSEEAKLIDNLINNFKTGMHPYADQSGVGAILGFPDVWVLEPMFNLPTDSGISANRHPQMPKTKLCALTRMNVNTTPANQFTTTDTGALPLQTVQMTFEETTALTQSDLESGNY